MKNEYTNPLTKLDYPDPDVIRVGDTYYMVSTTMYFMPGCEILRSYDLVNWERAGYVYETLDSTPAQRLAGEGNIYGQGMWAASLRYHKGLFYICFVANDTRKTYLYTAKSVEGPWEKRNIEGFYHDCSLLFDDDDRVYVIYGNRDIHLTELKADLTGPKPGGTDRIIVSDAGNPRLGYEGSHFYKINGKYYAFFIHSLKDHWKRTEACFVADSPEGEFVGGDVLNDDMGYFDSGVAQGGIVDTPDGEWYAVLFQDRAAVGRIPVLVPVRWENGFPVFGIDGKVPLQIRTKSTRPGYRYKPLVESDDFQGEMDSAGQGVMGKGLSRYGLKESWQFNHEPDWSLASVNPAKGCYAITTGKLCSDVTQAVNTLTQRMREPACRAYVTVDAGGLKDGDYAGICALQGFYGLIAVTKQDGRFYLSMRAKEPGDAGQTKEAADVPEAEYARISLETPQMTLMVSADFTGQRDEAEFFYQKDGEWVKIGITHKLVYRLDHFTGCRFGLFCYAAETAGGTAEFSGFVYE